MWGKVVDANFVDTILYMYKAIYHVMKMVSTKQGIMYMHYAEG